MPVKKHKGDLGRCDTLFSLIVRSYGRCEAEGWAKRPCSHQLQPAHIVTRGRSATRTDLRNAFCLCFAHHRFFHDFPREFSRFISTTWAQEYYDEVYRSANVPTKVNWKDRRELLEDLWSAIQEGELTLVEARQYAESY